MHQCLILAIFAIHQVVTDRSTCEEKSAVLKLSMVCLFIHTGRWTAVERQQSCGGSRHTTHGLFLDSNSASNKTSRGDHGGMQTELLLLASLSLAAQARWGTHLHHKRSEEGCNTPCFSHPPEQSSVSLLNCSRSTPSNCQNVHSCSRIFTHRHTRIGRITLQYHWSLRPSSWVH